MDAQTADGHGHRRAAGLGPELHLIRDWTESNFDFVGYVSGFDPAQFGDRSALRAELGYRDDEQVCIVTVGGSGVGGQSSRRGWASASGGNVRGAAFGEKGLGRRTAASGGFFGSSNPIPKPAARSRRLVSTTAPMKRGRPLRASRRSGARSAPRFSSALA